MTSRRQLLAGAAATLMAAPATSRRPRWPRGVQLWSVDALLRRDFAGTLRKLAALGYTRVEAAGWHGRTAAAFGTEVRTAGLSCDSAHVGLAELATDPSGTISAARDAGCRWAVCPAPLPAVPQQPGDWNAALAAAMTADDWRRNAEVLNRAAAIARRAGLGFGYHNHAAEFIVRDGWRGFDLLLEHTDAALVSLELDVAWAQVGGEDPAVLIRRLGRRVRLLHLKDAVRDATGKLVPAALGDGVVNWRTVFVAADAAGVTDAYVEVEAPLARPVLESLALVRARLDRLRR